MSKIMLVEDDNNLREIYEARLIAEGYEIVSAKDGEEALAMAVKEKPDLIISDVMMPKISGFDMLDILRTTPETKNTKIIMMTALSQAEDKSRADKLGADRYLVKSQVTLEDVAAVAREVLSGEAAADGAAPAVSTPPADNPTAPPATPPADPAAEDPVAATPIAEPTTATATPPSGDDPLTTATKVDEAPATPPADPAVGATTDETTTTEAAPAATQPATTDANTAAAASLGIDSNLMQSTADQKKVVESQIDDFLATVKSTDPPEEEKPAEPAAPPAPEAPATPPGDEVEHIDVAAAPPDATAAAADNAAKLANAVNDLLQKPAETTTEPPASETKKEEEPAASGSSESDAQTGGKKVIQPLNDLTTSTPDLNALLEKEELKEAGVTATPVAQAPPADNLVISSDGEIQNGSGPQEGTTSPVPTPDATVTPTTPSAEPTTPPAPEVPTDPNDPNSIAL